MADGNLILETMSPPHHSINLGEHDCISTGNDSNVYRVGDRVAKEYQRLTVEEVARYVALQNAAAATLPKLDYSAEFDMRGNRYILRATEAVAVDELCLSASGRPLTFSRFVPDANIEKLMWRPDRYQAWAQRELSDARLRAFADDLNEFFWNEYPTRVRDEIQYHVCMLSRRIEEALGVRGLYISKYNAKLRPSQEVAGFDLIVTDVALYIERVKYDAG